LRGTKPSKQNLSDGSPETASAVVTADGPGGALHRRARLDAGGDQPVAGITDQRHAGVTDQQDRGTGPDLVDQGRHPRRLIGVVS
jgi:hypothetical protein